MKFFETKKVELQILEETLGNPQMMSDKEFNGLVKSIKEKGFILDNPVVWEYEQNKYKIISGHHRIKAAMKAGYKELDCKILEDISEKQARLLVLEANQRRGKLDGTKFERYIQDILSDFEEINLDEIDESIGKITKDIIDMEPELQQESESLKLTITFKSYEEKEQFCEVLDFHGGRGRAISEKVKNFVDIILRDQKKKIEKEEKEEIEEEEEKEEIEE
jgi:ParB-like chromosome segregation protein Spo0J